MDHEFNNRPQTSNRFIFSDAFYDQFDNVVEDKKESLDTINIPPQMVEEPKQDERHEESQEEYSSFFSNNKTNMISDATPPTSESELENPKIPNYDFINTMNQENTNSVIPEKQPLNLETKNESESKFPTEIPNAHNHLNTMAEVSVPEIGTNLVETVPQQEGAIPVVSQEENRKIEEPKPNDFSSKFNVESGVDTTLEQEVLKSKVEPQMKIPIIENTSFYEKPSKEKMIYRATRNTAPITPVWLQEEIEKEKQEESTNLNSPENIILDHNEIEEPPKVINIDEELVKLANQNSQPALKKKIEYGENLSNLPVTKSDLLVQLKEKEHQTGKISILARYGEDFCSKDYITNPAIGRTEEIKQLMLVLLTPEKSAILVGKPGIGKTSIVEGLAYQLQRNNVPDALKGYCIVSIKTTSLLGTLPNGETRLQTMIDELKELDKIILFMDEIHMLMGATNESSLDFANMFKESLGRGSIKMIGATTNDEYERYVLRDKAFVRRFQRIDVEEPSREQTIKILMGTLPKIEKNTGAKLKYSDYVQSEIMAFIVDITTEYKRVYGIGSRYPDICLTLLTQAFSQAIFENRKEVNIFDIRKAIQNSKNIYPDVIRKELINFDHKFTNLIQEES